MVKVDLGQVFTGLPHTPIDRILDAGPVGTGFGAEDAPTGLACRLLGIQPLLLQGQTLAAHARSQWVQVIGLIKSGHGLDGSIEQADEAAKSVAEKTRYPQRHVHPRAVQQAQWQYLEIVDPLAAGGPHWAYAHQRHGLGNVVTTGTHGRGPPHRQPELAQVVAMVLQMAFEYQVGRREAQPPCCGGRQVTHIDGVEIAAGGQHVEPTTAGCTARPGRHEAPSERCKQPIHLGGAAGVQARRHCREQVIDNGLDGLPKFRLPRRQRAVERTLDNLQCQQFEALACIAGRTPGLVADVQQSHGPWALPGLPQVTVQRIEARDQYLGQGAQHTRIAATPIATLYTQQCQQRVQAQPTLGRLAEHMQTIADLRFLEVAQVGVQAWQPDGCIVKLPFELQFPVDVVRPDQFEDVALQLTGAARIEQLCFVEFVGQLLQVAQRAIGLGAGQRRHQVIDDHGLRASLGLRTLTRVVDDERIDVGQRAEQGIRPACIGQPYPLARQPFQVAVFADMNDGVGRIHMPQPEIERQVAMGWYQVRVVINGAGV